MSTHSDSSAFNLNPSLSSPSLPSSSSSEGCPSPVVPRPRPNQSRKQPGSIGVDPDQIVGKLLVLVRRSPTHPAVTLHFADSTSYQIRIDGYDPVHRGIPKELETNCVLLPLFNPPGGQIDVHLTVTHARMVELKDTAYEWSDTAQSRWNVEHIALALKFEEVPGWHCVWATMAEYDGEFGPCTFRSFEDVYLAELHSSPRKRKSQQKQGRASRGSGSGTPLRR